MAEWLLMNLDKIFWGLVAAGASALCGYLGVQLKKAKDALKKEEQDKADQHIEELLKPIVDDMEELRQYVREVDKSEKHKINLIVQSYRYRLTQLCHLYLKQGYMTVEQYDQLNEFFSLYEALGGNGEAKRLYDKVVNTLEVRP